jgi:alginate O-acetyltransferase complex protein AlgI
MFGLNGNAFYLRFDWLQLQNNIFFLIAAGIACTPLMSKLGNLLKNLSRNSKGGLIAYGVMDAAVPLVLMVLSTMALAGNSYNPFLYFQF